MEEDPVSSYPYDQWDEDLVDLSFQSVPDLHQLLTARGHQLEYQLYSQTAILHNRHRKELKSVTVKPSHDSSPTFSADYSSTLNSILFLEPASSYKSSLVSKDQRGNILGSPSTFSSFASADNDPGSWSILTSEDHHVYSIFCFLLIITFLFFIIFFLIIFRCKSSFEKRSKYTNLLLQSSYLKASISLEDSYSVSMNITLYPQPFFPSPIPCPPYSPLSSFTTFHPPGQDRPSPEGSSCRETKNGAESDQQAGESDEREEDKGHNEAESTACNMTSIEDDKEYLYAKINYQSKHHARKSVKRSESNEEVKLSSQYGHSCRISECLI